MPLRLLPVKRHFDIWTCANGYCTLSQSRLTLKGGMFLVLRSKHSRLFTHGNLLNLFVAYISATDNQLNRTVVEISATCEFTLGVHTDKHVELNKRNAYTFILYVTSIFSLNHRRSWDAADKISTEDNGKQLPCIYICIVKVQQPTLIQYNNIPSFSSSFIIFLSSLEDQITYKV